MGKPLLKSTADDNISSKPTKKESPKETAEKLYKDYKDTVEAYIESLAPLCLNLKNNEVFTIQ